MSGLRSFSFLLSAGFAVVVMIMVVVGIANGLSRGRAEVIERAVSDVRHDIALMAAMAERVLHTDSRLLVDGLTQRGAEPRLQVAAVVDPHGLILFASDPNWQGRSLHEVWAAYDRGLVATALAQKAAAVEVEGYRVAGLMSFLLPPGAAGMRDPERGLILLVYDVSAEEAQVFQAVLRGRMLEIVFAFVALLFAVAVMNRYVVRPLSRLESATKRLVAGGFVQTEALQLEGPAEIVSMTASFNRMAGNLTRTVAELGRQGAYTATIIDSVIDGLITIDRQGGIMSFNAAATRIFGYTEAEVVGRNVALLMPEPHRNRHDQYINNYLTTGVAKIIGTGRELQGMRKDGEVFPLELGVSKIELEDDIRFVGVIRDITERKKSERMKEEFISTVSHELRTPLTVLNGAVKLMQSGATGPLSAKAQELLDAAARNGDRLLSLINDLLDMEKIMVGKLDFHFEILDLQAIIEEAILVNSIYGERHEVYLRRVGEAVDCRVKVDMRRLIQVLSNFISNACKHSKPGATVEIGAEPRDAWVRVFVRDYGEGVPASFRARMFEKFTQADASDARSKGGTGLGLAISKELVERMGGVIGYESELGKGSMFFFDLPVHRAD